MALDRITIGNYNYKIVERNHQIFRLIYGRYIRHNELYRIRDDQETQKSIAEELITVNDALMMYAPLLPGEAGSIEEMIEPTD